MAKRIQHHAGVSGSKNTLNSLASRPWSGIPEWHLMKGFLIGAGVPEGDLSSWERRRQLWIAELCDLQTAPADRATGDPSDDMDLPSTAADSSSASNPAASLVDEEPTDTSALLPPRQDPTALGPYTGQSRTRDAGSPSRPRILIWMAGIMVLAVITAVVLAMLRPGPAGPVSGTVTCVSGAEVVGVFIRPLIGRGDFAGLRLDPDNRSKAYFNRSLNPAGPYAVHVGCGRDDQDPREWRTNIKSSVVNGSGHSFECDDTLLDGSNFWGQCSSR